MSPVHFSSAWALREAVRGAALLAFGLAAARLARRASAAHRSAILGAVFAALLAAPIAAAFVPATELPRPSEATAELAPPRPDVVAIDATSSGPAAPRLERSIERQSGRSNDSILLALWAAGALVVVARHALGAALARRLVTKSGPAPWIACAFERARDATRVRRAIAIRASEAIDGPVVVGSWRPVVLVPAAAETWPEDRLVRALIHEIGHVVRRDTWTAWLIDLAVAVHWFNPLAWIAARDFRRERERACDDFVVRSGARPSKYASDLLALASGGRVTRALPMAGGAFHERIMTILEPGRSRAMLTARGRLLLFAGAAATALAAACAAPTGASVSPPTTSEPATSQRTPGETLERIAAEEAAAAARALRSDEIAVVALEARTGKIVALAGRRGDVEDRTLPVRVAHDPGSVVKPILYAAAIDRGVLSPDERIDCSGPAKLFGEIFRDPAPNGPMSARDALVRSSNVGAVHVFERVGFDPWRATMERAGFFRRPLLDDAAAGGIPAERTPAVQAAAVLGEGITATPLQLAAAIAAFANGGVYVEPSFDGRGALRTTRVVSSSAADAVLRMMEGVVDDEHGTGRAAHVEGVRVAGKTGTAELDAAHGSLTYASFVGVLLLDEPIAIGVNVAARGDEVWGGRAAAPVFARIATRWLASRAAH